MQHPFSYACVQLQSECTKMKRRLRQSYIYTESYQAHCVKKRKSENFLIKKKYTYYRCA